MSDVTNVGPFNSFGDVSINNLTITGTYSQDLDRVLLSIADFASFVATNVSLTANAPWGLFNLDEVGGDVDLGRPRHQWRGPVHCDHAGPCL